MICPKCNSETVKWGKSRGQRYKCKECRYEFTFKEVVSKPNVLVVDVETTPLMAYTWGCWQQNINPVQLIKESNMLTWSAKWLYEPEIFSDRLTSKEAKAGDDKRLVTGLWKFLEAANVVIAHNLDKFDNKVIKTRFFLNGLKPTTPYQGIDTLKVVKREFKFPHNRLDWIHKRLGGEGKIETDFDLWKRCMDGDDEALEYMEKYNREDVKVLEEVYTMVKPWIKSHPNMALFVETDGESCPTCSSVDLNWTGSYATMVNKYSSFRCGKCGAIGRSRHSELTKEDKTKILQSIAR